MNQTVVLLAGHDVSTSIVYNALAQAFDDVHLIVEKRVPRHRLLRRRIRQQGLTTVIGQVLFLLIVVPILKYQATERIVAIKREYGLDDSDVTITPVHIPSVNSDTARQTLQRLNPRVVIVNGTRIIGRKTLSAIDAPFINIHAGITPMYRGAHGGYWALLEGNTQFVGTTIHFVDHGIDTGQIINQSTFKPLKQDSFVTYPYLHLAVGIPLLLQAVEQILTGAKPVQCRIAPHVSTSSLHYHPTLWRYLFFRWSRLVK